MSLPPLIRWAGGQSRESRKLRSLFPDHDTYIEPFAGGASFFFAKDPVPTEVLGDTNTWLMPFYDAVRRGEARKCRITYSRDAWKRARRRRTACDVLTVSANGYMGQDLSWDHSKGRQGVRSGQEIYRQKLSKLPAYEKRLLHAHLTRRPFEETVRKFDNKNAWHVWDPPWPDNESTERFYQGKLTVPPARVAEVASEMEGNVWILYNDHDTVRQAFCSRRGFHCHKIKTTVFHRTHGEKDLVKLLITNRPLKRKVKGLTELNGLEGLGEEKTGKISDVDLLAGGAGTIVSLAILSEGRVDLAIVAAAAGAVTTAVLRRAFS